MSDYLLQSWSTIDSQRIMDAAFCSEIEFSIGTSSSSESISYYFIICNKEGLLDFINRNFYKDDEYLSLKRIVIIEDISNDILVNYLMKNISDKCISLNNKELFSYLEANYNNLDDTF